MQRLSVPSIHRWQLNLLDTGGAIEGKHTVDHRHQVCKGDDGIVERLSCGAQVGQYFRGDDIAGFDDGGGEHLPALIPQ